MPVRRESYTFPTRSYPYRYPDAESDAAVAAPAVMLESGRIYRFVLGLDAEPRPMTDAEANDFLRDPFAELLLKRGTFPLTLRELLDALDAVNNAANGLPQQKCFLVADGGQIPWTPETANLNRQLRFVIVRFRSGDARLMISASTVLDSSTQFIQLLAWDADNEVYNFYERRASTWIWAGHSHHALAPETRGQGPFDNHVNGSLVMKELRQPWNNWHSMNASIQDNVLSPDDPLRTEPLFINRVSAHELELEVVQPGIERWNLARLRKAFAADGARLANLPFFFRHVLETTTINLISSNRPSSQITDDELLTLPLTFFLNTRALLDSIGLEPEIAPINVVGRLYRNSLKRYDFALTDGRFRQEGDTFFAFLVPEPAYEDLHVLALLLQRNIISPRFAACLLMIDFPNPIFSAQRKQLLGYVPATVQLGDDGTVRSNLETEFVAAVEIEAAKAVLAPDSPEQAFLANWQLAEDQWQRVFEKRIEDYVANLEQQAKSEEGFDGWVRLAESRRREFRRRPLAEFKLTVPSTNLPFDAPTLIMSEQGTVLEAIG